MARTLRRSSGYASRAVRLSGRSPTRSQTPETALAMGPPLRVVVGPLEVIHRGREVDDRLVVRLKRGAGNGTKVRELAEREIQLERGGFKADPRDCADKVRGQVLRAHETEEGPSRIRVAEDRPCIHLTPVG